MPVIRDVLKTSDFEPGITKLDVRDKIFNLQPDETPYYQLVMKAKPLKTISTQFHRFEDDLLSDITQLNGAITAATTTITVDDASIFKPYDVIKVLSTGEVMLVNSVNVSANQITVTRGWGVTAATAASDNAYLKILGTAMPEGSSSPVPIVTSKTKLSNYVQIFKRAVKITKTAEMVESYGGSRRNYERKKQAVELKRSIEAQFIWGEPKEDLTGDGPKRQTGGIIYFLSNYGGAVMDLGGAALTETAWDNFLKEVFTYSTSEVYALMGARLLSVINGWAKNALQMRTTDKTYGIQVQQYYHSMGIVNLVYDMQLNAPNDNMILAVRPEDLGFRYLRDITLELDLQKGDDDFYLDQYICEIGFECGFPKHHGLLKNIG